MIEVSPGLHVGNQQDFAVAFDDARWAVVHACKEPYHRDFVGYTEQAAPRDSTEYLFAMRGDRLALNMVDVKDPKFFHGQMMDAALRFITRKLKDGKKVLVHCNQGGSRAPGLALLWLRRHDPRFSSPTMLFDEGEALMRDVYPLYAPADGIRGYVREHWGD